MTPATRKTLTDAVDLIRAATNADSFDAPAVRAALERLGARITVSIIWGGTNTIRLAGITASCSWDAGEHLLTRWAANARKALETEGEE